MPEGHHLFRFVVVFGYVNTVHNADYIIIWFGCEVGPNRQMEWRFQSPVGN